MSDGIDASSVMQGASPQQPQSAVCPPEAELQCEACLLSRHAPDEWRRAALFSAQHDLLARAELALNEGDPAGALRHLHHFQQARPNSFGLCQGAFLRACAYEGLRHPLEALKEARGSPAGGTRPLLMKPAQFSNAASYATQCRDIGFESHAFAGLQLDIVTNLRLQSEILLARCTLDGVSRDELRAASHRLSWVANSEMRRWPPLVGSEHHVAHQILMLVDPMRSHRTPAPMYKPLDDALPAQLADDLSSILSEADSSCSDLNLDLTMASSRVASRHSIDRTERVGAQQAEFIADPAASLAYDNLDGCSIDGHHEPAIASAVVDGDMSWEEDRMRDMEPAHEHADHAELANRTRDSREPSSPAARPTIPTEAPESRRASPSMSVASQQSTDDKILARLDALRDEQAKLVAVLQERESTRAVTARAPSTFRDEGSVAMRVPAVSHLAREPSTADVPSRRPLPSPESGLILGSDLLTPFGSPQGHEARSPLDPASAATPRILDDLWSHLTPPAFDLAPAPATPLVQGATPANRTPAGSSSADCRGRDQPSPSKRLAGPRRAPLPAPSMPDLGLLAAEPGTLFLSSLDITNKLRADPRRHSSALARSAGSTASMSSRPGDDALKNSLPSSGLASSGGASQADRGLRKRTWVSRTMLKIRPSFLFFGGGGGGGMKSATDNVLPPLAPEPAAIGVGSCAPSSERQPGPSTEHNVPASRASRPQATQSGSSRRQRSLWGGRGNS